MERLKDYEYKAPSYERFEREDKYVIHEEEEQAASRYYFEDGIWHTKVLIPGIP